MEVVQDYLERRWGEIGAEDTSVKRLHERLPFRSLFIADPHLGTRYCLARDLLGLMKHTRADYFYLLGDIFDFWNLGIHRLRDVGRFQSRVLRGQGQFAAISKILRWSDRGTKVVFIPGNHDSLLRLSQDWSFANVSILREAIHRTADNKHYLLIHGDVFDPIVRSYPWLGILGTRAYAGLARLSVQLDRLFQNERVKTQFRKRGLTSDWSLAQTIKSFADGHTYNQGYESALLAHLFALNAESFAKAKGSWFHKDAPPVLDGIIGAHTHVAMHKVYASPISEKYGEPIGPLQVTYWNVGHWTADPNHENGGEAWRDKLKFPTATALAEDFDGRLHLLQWDPRKGVIPLDFGKYAGYGKLVCAPQ